MGKIKSVFILLLILPVVFANHNRYDPYVDLNNIDWFDRGIYFHTFDFHQCVDLEEYYAYADSNPYDMWARSDIKDYKDRLSRHDYFQLADQDPYDNIERKDLDHRDDYYCSNYEEFKDFADENKYDRWDEEDYYRLRGYPNKYIYENYAPEYRYSDSYPPLEDSIRKGFRADGYGGVASWYR